jgi:ABC-type phosphate transport system substrate-binding protein
MKPNALARMIGAKLALAVVLTAPLAAALGAPTSADFPAWTSPETQRSALNELRMQASRLGAGTGQAVGSSLGANLVRLRFDELREAYARFKSALDPAQSSRGANDLSDLDAGLAIIESAFTVYRNQVADGWAEDDPLRNLRQTLRQATAVWVQQLNKDSNQLRVGW